MRRNMKMLITICLFSVSLSAVGQNIEFVSKNFNDNKGLAEAQKNLAEGNVFYKQGYLFYKNALPFYEKAQKFNPNNAELNYKLGKCYLESLNKSNALVYLERAFQLNPNLDSEMQYHLGMAYHLTMNWEKAIACYSKYQEMMNSGSDPKVITDLGNKINQCNNGKELVLKPLNVRIDNLGKNINTEYNEYGAVISADASVLVFTARQPNSTGGKIDPGLNENFEDIYISYKQPEGEWSKAVNLPKTVNTFDHDAVSAISADAQRMIIYSGLTKAGGLYESVLTGNNWSKPKNLGPNIDSKYHEPSGCYSPDGNLLYFVSNRPGGFGEHDIYMSKKDKKGRWGAAQNLGNAVNTSFDEVGVFMHPDGKSLYFSSKGHKSIGGYDIFRTVYNDQNGTWSQPENIGYPINTVDDDMFYVVSANALQGYYTSISSEGLGRRDLYMITFLEDKKLPVDTLLSTDSSSQVNEVKKAQVIILKGTIKEASSHKPLEAIIEIVDNQKNIVISSFKSNSASGKYLVSLPAGKNYGIVVKKEGHLFHSENIDVPADATFEQIEKDIELKNIAVGSNIVLKNIFFDFNKATLRPESTNELQRVKQLLKDTPNLKIEISGYTDSKGTNEYNKTLSEGRAKAVVDYLINLGITANRLVYKGYGENNPISTNETEAGRQLNRRTEFKVIGM